MAKQYRYSAIQKDKFSLLSLLGGQGWIQHLVDTMNSNKGRVFQKVIVDKYLNLLDGVKGGSLLKAVIKPYLQNLAYQNDYRVQSAIRKRKEQQQKAHKQKLKKQQEQLTKDVRVEKQKQTGKTVNLKRSQKYQQQYINDVNKKNALKAQIDKVGQRKSILSQQNINQKGMAVADELLQQLKQGLKSHITNLII